MNSLLALPSAAKGEYFQVILRFTVAALLMSFLECGWAAPGTIQLVIGTVRIEKHFGQVRQAVKGDELYEGDTISTLENSNVQIRMIDDAVIWIRPSSRFKIEKYKSDQHGASKNEAHLLLISGGLREVTGSIGKAVPADFKLKTPNATIGIRGTEFDAMYLSPELASHLNSLAGTYNRVYQGATFLENSARQIALNKDQAGFVGLQPDDAPKVLKTIPAFLNTNSSGTFLDRQSAVEKSKTLSISIRSGDADSGSAPYQTGEVTVNAVEGDRALLKLAHSLAKSGDPTNVEVIAKVNGDIATLQFFSKQLSKSSIRNSSDPVTSSLKLSLGVWTDVSGRGPWLDTDNNVTSSRGVRPANSRVFLKVDEVAR